MFAAWLSSGANGTISMQLGVHAGGASSVRVQLHMEGWGLLDETYAIAVLAPGRPPLS